MREAARALDDVSDHLGEVLRHADELLADWSSFGAQVRTQVEREVGVIGEVVEGAVARSASAGLDRVITERLSALTTELTKLEQRARTASRAVAEQQQTDRRALWVIACGVVVANILLVALWLRPVATPVLAPEAVRIEPAPALVAPVDAAIAPSPAEPTAGSAVQAAATPEVKDAVPEPRPIAPVAKHPATPLPHKKTP